MVYPNTVKCEGGRYFIYNRNPNTTDETLNNSESDDVH